MYYVKAEILGGISYFTTSVGSTDGRRMALTPVMITASLTDQKRRNEWLKIDSDKQGFVVIYLGQDIPPRPYASITFQTHLLHIKILIFFKPERPEVSWNR